MFAKALHSHITLSSGISEVGFPWTLCCEPYTRNVYCSIHVFISELGPNFTVSKFLAGNTSSQAQELPNAVTVFLIFRYAPVTLL
jgi:hypothetical protein